MLRHDRPTGIATVRTPIAHVRRHRATLLATALTALLVSAPPAPAQDADHGFGRPGSVLDLFDECPMPGQSEWDDGNWDDSDWDDSDWDEGDWDLDGWEISFPDDSEDTWGFEPDVELTWEDPFKELLNDDSILGRDQFWRMPFNEMPGGRRKRGDKWPWVPGRYVVCAEPGTDIAGELWQLGYDADVIADGMVTFEGPWRGRGGEVPEALRLQLQLLGACTVEPEGVARTPEGSQSNAIVVGSEFGRTFKDQKAFRSIKMESAHQMARGRDIVIAVLDTGVDRFHTALDGRVLNGHDFVENVDGAAERPDFADTDRDGEVDESFGHGTMVAGILHAAAPEAWILPVRVLDSNGAGTSGRVAAGIRYAVESGANVINMSLGMRAFSPAVADAVQMAIERDVVIVVAAGNDGRRRVDFPGNLPGVVSVSALGVRGQGARFSNGNGRNVVAAPGKKIIGPYPGGTWARSSGTSFAAPMVSAAAALLVSREPWLRPDEVEKALTDRNRLKLDRLLR